jgi:hypothetical protein
VGAGAAVAAGAAAAAVGAAGGVAAVPPHAARMGTIRTSNSVSATLRRHVICGFRMLPSFRNYEESAPASLEATRFAFLRRITSFAIRFHAIQKGRQQRYAAVWYAEPGVYL